MAKLAATLNLWRTKPSGYSLQKWHDYTLKYLKKKQNDEGLVRCECTQLGLHDCGYSLPVESMRVLAMPMMTAGFVALTPTCQKIAMNRVDYEDYIAG